MASLGVLNPFIATNEVAGYTTTPTSDSTLTLDASSNNQQFFTGTDNHTVVLPDTATMVLGQAYSIANDGTQTITIQASDLNIVSTVPTLSTVLVTCIDVGASTAASWSWRLVQEVYGGGANVVMDNNATPTYPETTSSGIWYGLNTKANVSSDGGVAIGNDAVATGDNGPVAIGVNTVANAYATVALGAGANATNSYSMASGCFSLASGVSSLCVGIGADDIPACVASGNFSAVFGCSSLAGAQQALAVGYQCHSRTNNSITVGQFCDSLGDSSVCLGYQAKCGDLAQNRTSPNCIAIGNTASCISGGLFFLDISDSIAIGTGASSTFSDAVSIGHSSLVNASGSIAIGQSANASEVNCLSIGNGAVCTVEDGIALGTSVLVDNDQYGLGLGVNINSVNAQTLGVTLNASTRQVEVYPMVFERYDIAGGDRILDQTTCAKIQSYYGTLGSLVTVRLPDVTQLPLGYYLELQRESTDVIVVTAQNSEVISSMYNPNTTAIVTCIDNSTNAAASWSWRSAQQGYANVVLDENGDPTYPETNSEGIWYGSDTRNNVSSNGVAIGNGAIATGDNAVTVGYQSYCPGDSSVTLGHQALCGGSGFDSDRISHNSIAIGNGASCISGGTAVEVLSPFISDAIAIGTAAEANSNDAISIGRNSTSRVSSVAIGLSAAANGSDLIVIGTNAFSLADNDAISIGRDSSANTVGSMAIGISAVANHFNCFSIGNGANCTVENGIALGTSTIVDNNQYSLGIGINSNSVNAQTLGVKLNSSTRQVEVYPIVYESYDISAGDRALDATSCAKIQYYYGTFGGPVTITLPDVSTIIAGYYLELQRESTDNIVVNAQNNETVFTMTDPNTTAIVTCIDNGTNAAASWSWRLTRQTSSSANIVLDENATPTYPETNSGGVWYGSDTKANTGMYSVTIGNLAVGTGTGAVSIGYLTSATGGLSTAVGQGAVASGLYSVSIGPDVDVPCTASAESSIAIGGASRASGLSSIAVGTVARATSDDSTSIGSGVVTGTSGIGIGPLIDVSGTDGIAIGRAANTANEGAVCVGATSSASVDHGLALGFGATVTSTTNALGFGVHSDSVLSHGVGATLNTANRQIEMFPIMFERYDIAAGITRYLDATTAAKMQDYYGTNGAGMDLHLPDVNTISDGYCLEIFNNSAEAINIMNAFGGFCTLNPASPGLNGEGAKVWLSDRNGLMLDIWKYRKYSTAL